MEKLRERLRLKKGTAQCSSYPPEPDLKILIKHNGTLTQGAPSAVIISCCNIMRRFHQTMCQTEKLLKARLVSAYLHSNAQTDTRRPSPSAE